MPDTDAFSPRMDPDLRAAFGVLSAQIADVARAGVASASTLADLGADVRRLQRDVYGSGPPAPPGAAPLVARTSSHESEIDALAGQVIVLSGQLAEVLAMTKAQNRALGIEAGDASIGRRISRYLASREGRNLVLRLVTVAGVAWAAFAR